MNIIEYDEECPDCKGTGIKVGSYERDGAGVICHKCNGTGKKHVYIEYKPFTKRNTRDDVERVFEVNPGVCIEALGKYGLEAFGGMAYEEWLSGRPFPPGSEMREFVCPAQWEQARKSGFECWWCLIPVGETFSNCMYLAIDNLCWSIWDKENATSKLSR